MKHTVIATVSAALLTLGGVRASADSLFSLVPEYIPNFVAVGVGRAPDYFGSDDYFSGPAPAANFSLGDSRYLSITGNYFALNVSTDRNWRFGPSAVYRFGRDESVDDPVVSRMAEIDDTIEIGGFLRYQALASSDQRDRWSIGGNIAFDAGGAHDGYVASTTFQRWLPVGRFGALGLAGSVSYGSENYSDTYFSVSAADALATGLPQYSAGDGLRDARVMAVFVHPVSRHWLLGAGVMYSRILGDTADSPVVDIRGSRDQMIYGLGIGYTW